MQNSVLSTRITNLYGSQTSSVDFSTHNSVLSTTTRLYEFQFSSVDLCTQNSVLSTRITSLYGSQPSSLVLCVQNGDFRTRIRTWSSREVTQKGCIPKLAADHRIPKITLKYWVSGRVTHGCNPGPKPYSNRRSWEIS